MAEVQLNQLAIAANNAFRAAGVQFGVRDTLRGVEARALIPTRGRPLLVVARIALPSDTVGYADQIGAGKIRKKLKSAAKKIAKSKVLHAVSKLAKVASFAVPGGNALTAATTALSIGKKLAKAAKHTKDPKKRARIASAAQAVAKAVNKQARRVLVASPGYPNPMAASQPGATPASPFGGRASAGVDAAIDTEGEEISADYEDTQGDVEPVEVDASDGDTESDEPEQDDAEYDVAE